jgi:GntR family transcriptional regulator
MYRMLILKGAMKPDEPMPSVRKLAMELSTNPNTVQKAYTELEREGYIYSVKGRGNFVRDNPDLREKKRKELKDRLDAIFKEASDIGINREELLK